ncbi:unnamed protein product [Echinostoma caproni]|uniref:Serine/threonine-protein kinase ATR n=1 Tax=Echinostoma caproni TaxID=27848 RepID=A0A183A1C1_9TREM|nr:unnamed protein product [Echinostoma caproni]
MEVALRLAATLFSVVPLVELVEHHQAEILQALNSNRVALVCFVLNKLVDGLHETSLSADCIPDAILNDILSLVLHEELRISQVASQFLSVMALELCGGLERLLSYLKSKAPPTLYPKAEHVLRISELVVKLAVTEPSKFSLIEDSQLLQPVLDGLLVEDPLTNLNFLQIAKALSSVPLAYDWLDSRGVFRNLLNRLLSMDSDGFRNLILPGKFQFLFYGRIRDSNQSKSYWRTHCL